MTTDEQKEEVILKCLNSFMKGICDIYQTSERILELLKQFDPEPLEVEVFNTIGAHRVIIPRWFTNKQSAIDFCAKHGLKIK